MSILSRLSLKNLFKTGMKPSENDFSNWLDSFYHKEDSLPGVTVDQTIIANSTNSVAGGAVYTALSGKEVSGAALTLVTALIGSATINGNTLKKLEDRIAVGEALMGSESGDADSFVSNLREVLAILSTYPEGTDVLTILNGKANALSPDGMPVAYYKQNMDMSRDAVDAAEYAYRDVMGDVIHDKYATNEALAGKADALTNNQIAVATTTNIIPDFSVKEWLTTNTQAASETAVSNSAYSNLPIKTDFRTLRFYNASAGTRTLTLKTTNSVANGITYTFQYMNSNVIAVPTLKTVEVSYSFIMTGSTTCMVSIISLIQA